MTHISGPSACVCVCMCETERHNILPVNWLDDDASKISSLQVNG